MNTFLIVLFLAFFMVATNRFEGRGTGVHRKEGLVRFNQGGTLGVMVIVHYPINGREKYWCVSVAIGFGGWWKRGYWDWSGCGNECGFEIPYGWVVHGGCSVHDPLEVQ